MTMALQKVETGVTGFDDLTRGGLPKGRATLVCGGPGCGKTLLATCFLMHGAANQDEPGVMISFDERPDDLYVNTNSLGFDLQDLEARKLLAIDFVHIERSELEQSGAFDLEGLFIRIDHAVQTVGAKRVVLDTIDTLFAGLPDEATVRAELRRLFGWLKDKGLTTVITAERGEKTFSRQGIEEYVSDCVVLLDHRVNGEVSTRRLRIVKYRGTTHGTNEYPFLIGEDGLSVLPVTSVGLTHNVSSERQPTGIAGLDEMLEGQGYYKGSSVLISGGPGCGKSSLAGHFVEAACARGETCLYFGFEESPQQIVRNMNSIGINLQPLIEQNLLHFHTARPTEHGLETHLAIMHRVIQELSPSAVVIDPISALVTGVELGQSQLMMLRLIDYLKSIDVTTLFLDLQQQSGILHTEMNVSSLMDTWLLLQTTLESGDAKRQMQIVKSRGMSHPLQLLAMEITKHGVTVGHAGKPR